MSRPRVLAALLLLLLAPLTSAQQVLGQLTEVRVEGTTNYADIIRTLLIARRGTPVDAVDIEAERNRAYSLGTFETVTVSIEQTTAGPVLLVKVRENPRIGEIEFDGAESLPVSALKDAVRSTNLVEEGRVLNTVRAEEARETIRQVYRGAGMPYDVSVDLLVEEAAELAESEDAIPVRLVFQVDESAEVRQVTFEGNTVLTDAELEQFFQPLKRKELFDAQLYTETVQAVANRYDALGYRGSGVDAERTELQGGTLNVTVRELVIDSIDATALGVDPSEIELKPGDLFNYDDLLTEVKRLARGRSSDVQLQAGVSPSGGVRVTFRVGAPETAGPVDEVIFEGNTVLSDEELTSVLTLTPGDTFTSVVAEADFAAIVRAYRDKGYRVVVQPDYSYDEGSYVQRVTELKIAGYEVEYDGEPSSTRDETVTRYLPKPGSVVNDQRLVASLRQVAGLGIVEVVNYGLEPAESPGEAVVTLQLRKSSTGELRPAAQYATDTGLSASLAYTEKNLFGLAHQVGVELDVSNTALGLMFGGSLTYDVPWLYLDFLDFKETPTSLSASIFSIVNNNQALSANGQTTTPYPGVSGEQLVRVGEFTSRSTGVTFRIGRPVAPFTYVTLSTSGSHTEYKLEPTREECIIEAGVVENAGSCSLSEADALQHLPLSGLYSFTNLRVDYDERDNPNFPTTGLAAYGTFGVGFGNDMLHPDTRQRTNYNFQQVTGGVRTYLQLSSALPDYVTDPNHVFAVRLDVGHQFGGLYPVPKRFLVGRTNDVGPQIRGFKREDINLSRTYATSSLEYRYDFNLDTLATDTVIALAFVDVGWPSSVPNFPEYETPVLASAGLGVQVNLGFAGVSLPAVRMDYAFSERHPRGVFSFRIGPVF